MAESGYRVHEDFFGDGLLGLYRLDVYDSEL
jgi:hypothetical protein